MLLQLASALNLLLSSLHTTCQCLPSDDAFYTLLKSFFFFFFFFFCLLLLLLLLLLTIRLIFVPSFFIFLPSLFLLFPFFLICPKPFRYFSIFPFSLSYYVFPGFFSFFFLISPTLFPLFLSISCSFYFN